MAASQALIRHSLFGLCLLAAAGTVSGVAQAAAPGAPASMDELLRRVRSQENQEDARRAQRESEFLAARDRRAEQLAGTEKATHSEQKRTAALSKLEQKQQLRLETLRTRLKERSRELTEVFTTAKQVAKETSSVLESSLITAQDPSRATVISSLADRQELPAFAELEGLWLGLLDDMVQSGKVTTFDASIISAGGQEEHAQVLRIGAFNATSQGRFLRFLPQSKQLVELIRQPPQRYRGQALALQTSAPGTVITAPLDPSRGSILALLTQSPTLWERVVQGGGIGYAILAVGLLGLLIVAERAWALSLTARKVAKQLVTAMPSANNPLGRLLLTYAQHLGADTESLVLRLEERVQKEVPEVQKRLSTLAVLAAIAPLLGLLGTVTGMIVTFQSISLHGTSDPKLMSGGISQALVTTELGLAVAIPLTLLHTLLSSRSRRLIQTLDEKSTSLVADRVESQTVSPNERHATPLVPLANLETTIA